MKNLLYFDVEWANSKNKSICQMGLVLEDFNSENSINEELNLYVNPDDDYDIHCVAVHHITKEITKNYDTFDIVWDKISSYFVKSIIVGHNVKSADIDALVKNLNRYKLDIPELYFIDTYEIAKEVIPSSLIENYTLTTLCNYFNVEVKNNHDAYNDALACSRLLHKLIKEFDLNIENYIHKYEEQEVGEFSKYVSSPVMRREVNQLFGKVIAIGMDNEINEEESKYLLDWKNEHIHFKDNKDVEEVIIQLEKILTDNIITNNELNSLRYVLSEYVHSLEGSLETLASQQLQGILEGIMADKEILNEEIDQLNSWLYENDYLSGHYPYDILLKEIQKILEDKIVTTQEKEDLKTIFNDLFDPLKEIKENIVNFKDSAFCLSGDFIHGSKSEVSKYIEEKGGLIHSGVKKTTNYVVVGGCGSDSYSNGSFGTKVKRALELGIIVLKEEDIYN